MVSKAYELHGRITRCMQIHPGAHLRRGSPRQPREIASNAHRRLPPRTRPLFWGVNDSHFIGDPSSSSAHTSRTPASFGRSLSHRRTDEEAAEERHQPTFQPVFKPRRATRQELQAPPPPLMPCYFNECEPLSELQRFGTCLVGLYGYHFLWDTIVIRPVVTQMVSRGYLTQDKYDKMRESLWKNAAVGSFFAFGLYIGHDKDWFMTPSGYFSDFPYTTPEILKWYYMIYLSFWFQGIDFMLNITSKQYVVKRKDNAEMLLHHFATIALMVFSYYFDLTRVGMCVLMIHDVNDLLLETAKVFVYMESELLANIMFGTFAVVWFIVRWYFYSKNILYSVYTLGWDDIVQPAIEKGSLHGVSASSWYYLWVVFFGFLLLLLVLHVYWGVLIVKMVIKALGDGNVEKDIRSDSEDEGEKVIEDANEEDEDSASDSASAPVANGKPKRRRAPKAE